MEAANKEVENVVTTLSANAEDFVKNHIKNEKNAGNAVKVDQSKNGWRVVVFEDGGKLFLDLQNGQVKHNYRNGKKVFRGPDGTLKTVRLLHAPFRLIRTHTHTHTRTHTHAHTHDGRPSARLIRTLLSPSDCGRLMSMELRPRSNLMALGSKERNKALASRSRLPDSASIPTRMDERYRLIPMALSRLCYTARDLATSMLTAK